MNATKIKPKTPPIVIEWAHRADIAAILEIEHDLFEFPWTENDFIHCLRQRDCIGMTAVIGDIVAGYIVYELHAKRMQVLNFAVRTECQLKGVGRAMMAKLINKLSSQRRSKIVLHVRETNLDACLFFKAVGMRAVATVEEFFDNGEDAYRFEYLYKAAKSVAAEAENNL